MGKLAIKTVMIYVKLSGGLGNQMFQYAAARALSLRLRTELLLDISWFKHNSKTAISPRSYELGVFTVEAKKYDGQSVISKLFIKKHTVFQEKYFQYNSDILEVSENTLLEGYWQSEKYFEDKAGEIRKDFTFNSKPTSQNYSLLREIQMNKNSISLHVRRGDYVSDKKTNQVHGLAGIDYYSRALDLISEKIREPHYYIFSDDPGWCKNNLNLKSPATFIEHNVGTSSFEDMRLMSACYHNIIANSSFSWWGAWLNANQTKTVIAPKDWFNNAVDTSDLIPKTWIRL
jgi:hypothetical protein